MLVWGHFVVTFVHPALRGSQEEHRHVMNWVCGWMLLNAPAWTLYWLIIPERAPSLTSGRLAETLGHHGEPLLWLSGAWIGDVVAFVGIGGICAWAYLRRLANASLYPCRDPRLLESVACTN